MKTVTVIEGFSGGPMHTRQFRESLTRAGFKVIRDRQNADVIIAHSAGIYSFPPDVKAKLVILIGPTYWPGQNLIKRMLRHAKTSKQYHVNRFGRRFYAWKRLLEIYYFVRRHRYLWLGVFNNNRVERLVQIANMPGRTTIIVRNSDDPYSSPKLKSVLKNRLKFVDLPGVHDDYLMNPQPYIDLIKQAI